MIWGIIAALNEELALILSEMNTTRVETIYGLDFHVGSIGDKTVIAVCCSIGTINAAVCTSTLIRELGAEAVINIGVAGSTCNRLRILDVVLGSELVFHDADLDIIEKYYPFRRSFMADEALLALAEESTSVLSPEHRWEKGLIATGDLFVEDSGVKEEIAKRCDCLCVEMEGAAIAQVAYMNNTPFLIIRCLSDEASEDAGDCYDNFLERAAHNSASIVLEMVRRG